MAASLTHKKTQKPPRRTAMGCAHGPAALGTNGDIGGASGTYSPPIQGGPQIQAPVSPRDILLSYQRRWADDASRFKIGLMARQVGKDFSSGEEGVRDCYLHELENNKVDWLIGAPSERQSMESLGKWKEWTEAYHLAIADVIEERFNPLTGATAKNSEALLKTTTIVFPNGSRVIAVPGRPDTLRGFSANLLLTEFAFFEDPDATWRACLPSITNPLRGGVKKVRLISTPNGVGNKFHDLWSKNFGVAGAKWSCHKVTITDAVREGLPIDIEELRQALDDPEGWAQEYDPLDFIDQASVLLPYDLIAGCEDARASESMPMEYWSSSSAFPVDLGIDFGRRKDLTVCLAAEQIAGLQVCKEVLCLERMSTPDQVEILRPRLRKARRASLDYTGPGIGLGDYLVKEFGEWNPDKHLFGKIELCTFTNALKCELFPKLRMAMERRDWRLPVSKVLREDLHSVNRITLAGGGITYRAPHTPDGHADRCTALALCNRAGAAQGLGFSATLI